MITPQPQAKNLAAAFRLKNPLYLKREDLHPLRSHKGRSIPPMIEKYAGEGTRDFVISSSGNAALAAVLYIKDYNKIPPEDSLNLKIFLGENINKDKLSALKKLASASIKIIQTKNPKQDAFKLEKSGQAKNLRQSTDDTALLGYRELAKELAEIKNLSAVFIPTSSGTTAEGLHEGFKKLGINPQIHIVQTTACHPLADAVVAEVTSYPARAGSRSRDKLQVTSSIATAIVDKVALRKTAVTEAVEKSNGTGWVAEDKDIIDAIKSVKKNTQIDISPNSALSVAGLMLAIKSGWKFPGAVALLCTGK